MGEAKKEEQARQELIDPTNGVKNSNKKQNANKNNKNIANIINIVIIE